MIACFNEDGEQIPELQECLLSAWAARAQELGYDVNGLEVETQQGQIRLVRDDFDLSWNTEHV